LTRSLFRATLSDPSRSRGNRSADKVSGTTPDALHGTPLTFHVAADSAAWISYRYLDTSGSFLRGIVALPAGERRRIVFPEAARHSVVSMWSSSRAGLTYEGCCLFFCSKAGLLGPFLLIGGTASAGLGLLKTTCTVCRSARIKFLSADGA